MREQDQFQRSAVREETFEYKEYQRGGKRKEMIRGGEEFRRRFLQHVLPAGFVRVRRHGLLANWVREGKLWMCRRLLVAEPARRRVETARGGGAAAV